jgi:peptide deformylase
VGVDPSNLRILSYPAPALRDAARPITDVDDTVRAVAARMLELTRAVKGVGLAAPQVGLPWRLFVTTGVNGDPDRVYVNPALELGRDLVVREEGCLSIPGISVEIRRPASVAICALDLDGVLFTLHDDDLLARIWQHETDHLDGILIIDRMSPLDRLATRKALRELEAAAGEPR